MMRHIWLLIIFFMLIPGFAEEWIVSKSENYLRITDTVIRDIDGDQIDEIIISSYSYSGKYIDIYQVNQGKLSLIDRMKVPVDTIFFDVGDLDNNGTFDVVFLTPEALLYHPIIKNSPVNQYGQRINPQKDYKKISHIRSQLVVPQPELLTCVPMIIDLDGDKKNELVIENIRAIEIFETSKFQKMSVIDLKTILEFSLIPGQFYPHYIFYTLPIILITDIDGDQKKEIITKFPRSLNVFSQTSLSNWILKKRIHISEDNVYFLSDSFIKFSFPVIADIDNDNVKELIISTANLDMPRLRFEAVGDVHYFNKNNLSRSSQNKIVIKGIPLNLPVFLNISSNRHKDLICPTMPFNIFTIFSILSGHGNIKLPFLYYPYENGGFNVKNAKKIFEIPFRIENIMSFVEEMPLDQHKEGEFPDFYYFQHDLKEKKANINYYYHYKPKKKYYSQTIAELDIPAYRPELPANLKLGSFSSNQKKDVIFIIHRYFYVLSRKN